MIETTQLKLTLSGGLNKWTPHILRNSLRVFDIAGSFEAVEN